MNKRGLIAFLLLALFLFAGPVMAETVAACKASKCTMADEVAKAACDKTCEDAGAANSGVIKLDNPLGENIKTPADLYSRLIFGFMGVTGVIALLMFVIGGLQWMTAGGAADKVKKGKDTLIWAALGLVIIFSSYAILRAIFETLNFS
ncbi:MAG: pilin [Candidatus Komeilibacteria bacterium]|nr:pilin [Candidatus Komeilibacteria bacterium]